MATTSQVKKVRVGFIGTGAVTAYHHLPGLLLDPRPANGDLRYRTRSIREAPHRMECRVRDDRSAGVMRLR